jgi:hypothetical protein
VRRCWIEHALSRSQFARRLLEEVGTKTLRYIYDFGDGWKHTIKIEQLTDPELAVLYPRLIAATGRCRPEDCGGPWGYAEFLDAISDPGHERHADAGRHDGAIRIFDADRRLAAITAKGVPLEMIAGVVPFESFRLHDARCINDHQLPEDRGVRRCA